MYNPSRANYNSRGDLQTVIYNAGTSTSRGSFHKCTTSKHTRHTQFSRVPCDVLNPTQSLQVPCVKVPITAGSPDHAVPRQGAAPRHTHSTQEAEPPSLYDDPSVLHSTATIVPARVPSSNHNSRVNAPTSLAQLLLGEFYANDLKVLLGVCFGQYLLKVRNTLYNYSTLCSIFEITTFCYDKNIRSFNLRI